MTDKRKPHDALAGIRAILPAENEPASGDWKLVPVEPTEEMIHAGRGWREWDETNDAMARAYKAMLAAAPRPDLSELRALVERMRKAVEKPPEGVVTKWDYYVEGWTDELEALIERIGDSEVARLEREVAKGWAICALISETSARPENWRVIDDEFLIDYLQEYRYLELRGLLERHPEHPDWVRVKEAADGTGG